MKVVGRENIEMRQRMIRRYEDRRRRYYFRTTMTATRVAPSGLWEWIYGFREFMKCRYPSRPSQK